MANSFRVRFTGSPPRRRGRNEPAAEDDLLKLALLAYPELFTGRKVGLVLSGGNIDTRLLASVLLRGLATAPGERSSSQ